MATRAQFIANRFKKIVDTTWAQFECAGTQTTFTLYRRGSTGARSDQGVPAFQMQKVASRVSAVFVGLDLNDTRFEVREEGQRRSDRIELTTTFPVHEGDLLYMTFDAGTYLIESVIVEGPLRRCQANTQKGQFFGTRFQEVTARARIT